MNPTQHFQQLKKDVLLTYKKHFPYFDGDWKSFSSQDIANLIDVLEKSVKQTISEKWIYTHLKPESNTNLPRKDMLDILSQFVGYSGWEEYVFKHKLEVQPTTIKKKKTLLIIKWFGIALVIMVCVFYYLYDKNQNTPKTIEINNAYNQETIENDEVKAVIIENNKERQLEIKESKINLETDDTASIVIKSPFFKDKIIATKNLKSNTKIALEPDDYAMMVKAFMKSDIKDWETRKEQLHKILSDDLEVMVMLKNNLGVEYFNKQEFTNKLVIPSASLKKMKIVDLQNNDKQQISFIRIIQE